MPPAPSRTATPASRSLAVNASRWSPQAPVTTTEPPVIAAATMYVPASMRSGMTVTSAPSSSGRPSMVSSGVPAPRTRAPMRSRAVARQTFSGSRAAFSMTVVPSRPGRDPRAEMAEHGHRGPDVAQHGHVPDEAAAGGEQGGEEERQRRVLRAAHGDLAVEDGAAPDHDRVHASGLLSTATTRSMPA